MSNQANQQSVTNNQPIIGTKDESRGGCVVGVICENGASIFEVLTFIASDVPSKEQAIEFCTQFFYNEGLSVHPEKFAETLLEMYAEEIEQHQAASESSGTAYAVLIAALLQTIFWSGALDNTTGEGSIGAVTREEFEHWQKSFADDAKAGKLEFNVACSTRYH